MAFFLLSVSRCTARFSVFAFVKWEFSDGLHMVCGLKVTLSHAKIGVLLLQAQIL